MTKRRNNRRFMRSRRNNSGFPNISNTPVSAIRQIFTSNLALSGGTATGGLTFTNLPSSTLGPCRISSIDFEIAVAPGAASAVTGIFSLYRADGVEVTQTRPMMFGTSPTRFKLRMPKSTDFLVPAPSNNFYTYALAGNGTPNVSINLVVNYSVRSG